MRSKLPRLSLNFGQRRSADFRTVRCNRTESLALSHSGIPASGYLAGSLAGHFFHGDGNDAGLNGATKGSREEPRDQVVGFYLLFLRRFWGRCCELETGG